MSFFCQWATKPSLWEQAKCRFSLYTPKGVQPCSRIWEICLLGQCSLAVSLVKHLLWKSSQRRGSFLEFITWGAKLLNADWLRQQVFFSWLQGHDYSVLIGFKLLDTEELLPMKLKLKLKLYFEEKKLMKLFFDNELFIESLGQFRLFWHLWWHWKGLIIRGTLCTNGISPQILPFMW